jgi:hypothetical protein
VSSETLGRLGKAITAAHAVDFEQVKAFRADPDWNLSLDNPPIFCCRPRSGKTATYRLSRPKTPMRERVSKRTAIRRSEPTAMSSTSTGPLSNWPPTPEGHISLTPRLDQSGFNILN